MIKVEPTLLSHHLRSRREAGLVVAMRDGKSVICQLAPGVKTSGRCRTLDLGCCTLRFKSN